MSGRLLGGASIGACGPAGFASLGGGPAVAAAAVPVLDPATLALSGWWRENYVAGTWSGKASAGASTGRDLTEPTNPPTTSTVNGQPTLVFNGTNQRLSSALAMSDFLSANACTVFAVLRATIPVAANAPGANPAIFANNAPGFYVGAELRNTNTARWYEFAGGDKICDATATSATWLLWEMRLEGGALFSRINNGTEVTVAGGNIGLLTGTLNVAVNVNSNNFLNGQIAELAMSAAALTSAERAAFRSYAIARYGIT
jgi:hypothetical protein